MALFGHHMDGFLQRLGLDIDVNGKPFPDGPTEHLVVFGVALGVLVLACYGAAAAVRDLRRWRRRRHEVPGA